MPRCTENENVDPHMKLKVQFNGVLIPVMPGGGAYSCQPSVGLGFISETETVAPEVLVDIVIISVAQGDSELRCQGPRTATAIEIEIAL